MVSERASDAVQTNNVSSQVLPLIQISFACRLCAAGRVDLAQRLFQLVPMQKQSLHVIVGVEEDAYIDNSERMSCCALPGPGDGRRRRRQLAPRAQWAKSASSGPSLLRVERRPPFVPSSPHTTNQCLHCTALHTTPRSLRYNAASNASDILLAASSISVVAVAAVSSSLGCPPRHRPSLCGFIVSIFRRCPAVVPRPRQEKKSHGKTICMTALR